MIFSLQEVTHIEKKNFGITDRFFDALSLICNLSSFIYSETFSSLFSKFLQLRNAYFLFTDMADSILKSQ